MTGPLGNLEVPESTLDADLLAIAALTGTGLLARTAENTWALRSVAGTVDKITVTNGDGVAGNPTITIASTYVGQSSITTLGTIATGAWQGTAIAAGYGGTGLSAVGSANQIFGTNAAGTLFEHKTLSGTSNQVSVTHGVGTITLATPQSIATGSSPTFAGLNLSGLTASQAVFTDGSKNLVSNAITGSGNVMMSASPTTTGTLTAAAINVSSGFTSTKINAFLTATPVTGTASVYQLFNNSGGPSYIGQNDSTGVDLIGNAYAMVIQAASGRVINNSISGTGIITTTSNTGFAVTGAITGSTSVSSGNTTVGPGASGYGQLYYNVNTAGRMIVDAQSDGAGGELILFGSTHATDAGKVDLYGNTVRIRNLASTILASFTAGVIDFSSNTLAVGNTTVTGTLSASGNVGIGAASGSSKLGITGTTVGSAPYIIFTSGYATASYFGVSTQNNDIVTGDTLGDVVLDAGKNILFTTAGNNLRMKIDTSGLVAVTGTLSTTSGAAIGGGTVGSGFQVGSPTGGDKGAGTANFAADIYKNNTAYTNPDYVFEHWATGSIQKYAARSGAMEYKGHKSLDFVRGYVKEHYHLPGLGEEKGHGYFSGGDVILAELEHVYLHMFDFADSIKALETNVDMYAGNLPVLQNVVERLSKLESTVYH